MFPIVIWFYLTDVEENKVFQYVCCKTSENLENILTEAKNNILRFSQTEEFSWLQ